MQPLKKISVDGAVVNTDARSKSRIISFPFQFPDGENGALIVCRIKDESWVPSKEIKDITINFR